jgi:hypothetical protein
MRCYMGVRSNTGGFPDSSSRHSVSNNQAVKLDMVPSIPCHTTAQWLSSVDTDLMTVTVVPPDGLGSLLPRYTVTRLFRPRLRSLAPYRSLRSLPALGLPMLITAVQSSQR